MTDVVSVSFDDLAADYDRYRSGYSDELFDHLVGFGYTPGTSVLDIACGNGLASAPLVARGCTLTGVDPSEEMLANARTRVPEATFALGKAEALPFADRSFDHAICAQAFHWFEQARAFEEAMRVVEPGGKIAVWWKQLASDSFIRTIREDACRDAGIAAPKDVLGGAFRAFYAAPFRDRTLRALPLLWRTTVKTWIGYERSRGQARASLGSKREAYLKAIEKRLVAHAGGADAAIAAAYIQYLYVGQV